MASRCTVPLLAALLAWAGATPAEILFRAEDGAGQVVHVLTLAIKPAGADWQPSPQLQRALGNAGVLLHQADGVPNADSTEAQEFARLAMYPNGQTLKSEMGKSRWNSFEKSLRRQGLDSARLPQEFRPFMVSQMLAAMQYTASGIDFSSQVGDELSKRATAAGKPVRGLQTRLQAAMPWVALDAEAQLQILQWQAERGAGLAADIRAGWDLWQAGDAAGYGQRVAARLAEYARLDAGLPARLFAQRRGWLRRISDDAANSPLVIVNALDVLGPGGLLEGLGVAGFKVVQVTTAASK